MLKLENNGIELNIPQTTHEVTFSQFIDATAALNRILEPIRGDEHGFSEEDVNDITISALVAYCDAILFPSNSATIADACPDDLPHCKGATGFRYGSFHAAKDLSLLRVYEHLKGMFNDLDEALKTDFVLGDRMAFHHKGETYYFTSKAYMPDAVLTTNEAVEAREYARIAELQKKDGKDTDGAKEFTAMIAMGAIVWRKEGESLPINPTLRERFIVKRIEEFSDLSYQTVKEIDFFLTFIALNMLVSASVDTTLKGPRNTRRREKKNQITPVSKGGGLRKL
jgi:hypothetical protein